MLGRQPAGNGAGHGQPPIVPLSIQRHPSKWSKRFKEWSDFNMLSIFEPKRPPPLPRRVLVGVPLPDEAWKPTKRGAKDLKAGKVTEETVPRQHNKTPADAWNYTSNQVLTSKYNILTFLPKNLLEQFRRVANVFFLILVILQFFPQFTNVSPALAALPLIVVLAITAGKDGFEDYKRHLNDNAVNATPVRILQGGGFANPNPTAGKSRRISLRGLGFDRILPRWLGGTGGVSKAQLHSSDVNAEKEEAFVSAGATPESTHRRSFWGTRRVKKAKGSKPYIAEKRQEVPRDAPGGGTLQAARETASTDDGFDPYADDDNASATPLRSPVSPRLDGQDGGFFRSGNSSAASPPHWAKVAWEDLRVGDFVKLRGDEAVPADIVIVSTSEDENVCYVETKNLDGETNLKSRHAIPEMSHLRNARDCAHARFVIASEAPDNNMFRYQAAFEAHDGRQDQHGDPLKAAITLNTVLLRGTVVRNTEWVIGCVVTTGLDTKIVLNSGQTPSKRGRIERQMNPQVFANLALLAVMCVLCAIASHFLEVYYYNRNAYWEVFAQYSDDNPSVNGAIAFANAMITFQNIVPISLYISIEFIRTFQAVFIWADDEIFYEPTNRRTIARSWNLSDDLGQIEYVFSDKTGTLTQNCMQFHHCTVGGVIYRGDDGVPAHVVTGGGEHAKARDSDTSSATRVGDDKAKIDGDSERGMAKNGHDATKTVKLSPDVVKPFHDAEIERALKDVDSPQARLLHGFFVNLALCHTVLAAEDEDGTIAYKAQSPDEAALVQAAADVGFIFCGRDKNILRLQTPADAEPVEYELLEVLEFTSARKRMSVVVRKLDDPNKPLFLLMKGADNIVFERLAPGQDEVRKTTGEHLDDFASEGLRTLTLAYRGLDEAEYIAWSRAYHEATLALDDREQRIETVSSQLERDVQLLGATAIEDKLQDGVPEAIHDLKRAGIKVWVATGDKLETAVAIGMSSNLLTRDMNLIIVRGGAHGTKHSAYEQMRTAMVDFFDRGDELVRALENQPPESEHDLKRTDTGHSSRRGRPSFARGRPSAFSDPGEVADIVGDDNGQREGGYGLVIEGTALTHALAEPFSKDLLLELATRCQAVICCRTSPLQKALIVRLVREGLGAMTLAIGDGANDVSMIQAADVGVGVAGEEGLQAVNSADYAIGQFRFLKRLLLVHGAWSYARNANVIVNFFYKEIIGIAILFFFQFYCAFSTTTVYEYTYLLFWNIFWTLLPVIAMGLFDRSLNDRVLMTMPELYSYGRRGAFFGLKRFSWYMIDGIYQGAVIFFFLVYTYSTTTTIRKGYIIDMYQMSTTMVVAAVIAANVYNGFNVHAWNFWVLGSVLVGIILILCYTAVYAAIKPGWIWTFVYGNNIVLWPSAYWWLGGLFTIIVALLPRFLIRFWRENYRPTDIDIMKAYAKTKPDDHDFANDPAIPGNEVKRRPEMPRQSMQEGRPSFNMHRMNTDRSAGLEPTYSRGFQFAQDDDVGVVAVGRPLRRYTSSLHADNPDARTRPRSGSIRRLGQALNVFPPLKRPRSGSLRQTIFRPRSRAASRLVPEEDRPRTAESTLASPTSGAVTAPTSPARPVTGSGGVSRPYEDEARATTDGLLPPPVDQR